MRVLFNIKLLVILILLFSGVTCYFVMERDNIADSKSDNYECRSIKATINGIEIIDGDIYDYGCNIVSTDMSVRLIVENTGTAPEPLEIQSVSAAGDDAADFSIQAMDETTEIQSGESLEYDVIFNPSSKEEKSATISIDTNDGNIGTFSFTATGLGIGDGALSYIDRYTSAANINVPRAVTVAPDGNHVYVAAFGTSNTVAWFSRNSSTGALSYENITSVSAPFDLIVSPDNKHVYVASGEQNTITWFLRDTTTGDLTLEGLYNTNISGPRSIIVSPDGKHVYAGINNDDKITGFSRDISDGSLSFVSEYASSDNLDYVWGISISPDGNHVYAAAYSSNAVVWLTRNSSTGVLTYGGKYSSSDTTGTEDNIDGSSSVAVSPDGRHVYVSASMGEGMVAWFDRDNTTGALTYVGRFYPADTSSTDDGISSPKSIIVSEDGNHVYLAASSEDAVAWFLRDTVTGDLTYEGKYSSDMSTVYYVALSPDDDYLYAAVSGEDAIAWFSRDK